jgi:hypothetical protein
MRSSEQEKMEKALFRLGLVLAFLLGWTVGKILLAAPLDQPLFYSGTLSSAEHEQEEGIYNLVAPDAKPVLTIIIPSSWQRNEMRPFLGKKVTLTISEGTLQVLTRDHPQ